MSTSDFDAIVGGGGGHNGLTAAAYLVGVEAATTLEVPGRALTTAEREELAR